MQQVALITGASSGIGKDLAQIHAEHGGDLIIVARRIDKLNALKKELEKTFGVKVKVIAKDLTILSEVRALYDEITDGGIEVEYLINNAGYGGIGKFHERDWDEDLNMINLNIIALTALTRFFLPDFVKRDHGRILNISSTASLLPGPLQAVYYATKAFVTSFSNAISEELYDTDVTVTALLPGATKTEFGEISGMNKTSLFRFASDSLSVAQVGYDAMMNGELEVMAGLSPAQKMIIKSIPFVPKKTLLKQVRRAQKVRD